MTLRKSANHAFVADRADDTDIRPLSATELDAVTGAAVRYYVMKGTWWVCGRTGCANTGIPAN